MRTILFLLSFSFAFIFTFPVNSHAEDVRGNSVSDPRTQDEPLRPKHKIRYYGEKMIQAVKDENYDDLLKYYLEMASDYKMDPKEDLDTLQYLCSIYFLRNEPEKVMELLKNYRDEKKSHPMFLYISALCNTIAGHYEDAIGLLTKLIDDIELNKIQYHRDFQNGYINGIRFRDPNCKSFEEFMGKNYMRRAYLNVILGNYPAARKDWEKYCSIFKNSDDDHFLEHLDAIERSPNSLKCVVVKNTPNNYVRTEVNGIFLSWK